MTLHITASRVRSCQYTSVALDIAKKDYACCFYICTLHSSHPVVNMRHWDRLVMTLHIITSRCDTDIGGPGETGQLPLCCQPSDQLPGRLTNHTPVFTRQPIRAGQEVQWTNQELPSEVNCASWRVASDDMFQRDTDLNIWCCAWKRESDVYVVMVEERKSVYVHIVN